MFYDDDLARIQAADFGQLAVDAAHGFARHLLRAGHRSGVVIDLGCGAGPFARTLSEYGYDVWGVDISRPLVRRAAVRAPRAHIRHGSVHHTPLPRAVGAVSVGEVLQYFRPGTTPAPLPPLFQKIRHALVPGGLIGFDLITERNDHAHQIYTSQGEGDGEGWHIEIEASQKGPVLERALTITRGRQTTRELHCQYIWQADVIERQLKRAGFAPLQGRLATNTYGVGNCLPRRTVFLGRKIG